MTRKKYIVILPCFLYLMAILLGPEKAICSTGLRGEVYYGKASWYGWKFHGRKTSNGERFNKNKLTAAHNFLPFNTIVKVTNLTNDRSVKVRINDRGPFKAGRIIDLSEKAAEVIDAKQIGIIDVKIQVLSKADVELVEDKQLVSIENIP
ncbi:MAG: septal ring lytic transglycosylase RlpA family protein [Candidatus Melainabacteria bacterium]|nr:septal ring lytic transglycosylase RlpA family protein [Candidatus Melainabacteria bacterium]MBI3309062.1 septal ring lytic transglycosylase RlpA family protein [Candidatus Melainabacteria bacterium]